MELLPPVGWADVATKQDLRLLDLRFDALEERMDARFEFIEHRMDARFESIEHHMDAKFESSEHRMDAKFEKGFRQVIVTMTSLLISGFLATVVAMVVAVALR